MANGPLGGFMPTPPAPSQPPQVSLDTSAESRNNFKNFLGTLPKTATISPVGMGAGLSSPAPTDLLANNVNIFEPMQPVQMMQFGGEASGEFSDTDLSDAGSFDFSSPDSGGDFDEGFTEEEDPSRTDYQVDDSGIFTGTSGGDDDSGTAVVDTRPRTNIRNVGPTSNLRFDPQFTANLLQNRGLDPQGFMAPADFAQTTQGGFTPTESVQSGLSRDPVGLPPMNLVSNTGVLGGNLLSPTRTAPVEVDPLSVPLAPTRANFFGDLLDDPLGLGVRTGFGPVADAARRREALTGAFGPDRGIRALDQASLNTVVPGAGGALPDADPLAGDIIKAIRSGAAGLPFTRNPGALKQGQEDLTTEVIKELPEVALKPGQKLNQDFLAPAIFNTIDAGIQGIDRQLGLYANRPNLDITTPETLVNTYLASGNKENTPENRSAYIDAVKGVAGEKFDLNNATTRANISKAIANQEFGQAGKDVMADMRRGRDVSLLSGLNIGQLGVNLPVASDVNQLGSLDPIGQTQTRSQIPDVLPDISEESFRTGQGSNIRSGTTQVGPGGRFTFSETPGRRIGSLAQRIPLSPDVYSEGSFDIGGTAPTLTTGLIGTAPVGTQRAGSRGDIVTPNVPISRGMQDLTREDQQLIAPEIFGTGRIGGVTEETFRSLPADVQQRIVSNLGDVGTQITNIDPEPNRGIVPDTALETLQGARVQTPARDTVFDIDTTFDPITLDDRLTTVSPDTLAGIGREQRIDDANTFRQTVPDAARIFGGRQIQTTPVGLDSIVGDDVVPSLDIADIQGDVTQERVADILARPDRFKKTFKVGDTEFPNLIAALANKAGSFFDRRLFDGIVSKGLNAVVDPDTGRIIGAKDDLGNLIEGRDLEQFQPDDGGDDPVTKFLKKATEKKDDEEEDEKPPNVIGGGTPADPTTRPPTVVKSTAPESTARFTPVGFDAGNINQLIEQITGVRSPRRLQDGGAVGAVDRFLSKVA